MWYVCDQHKVGYDNPIGFKWHWEKNEHEGECDYQKAKREELPEGYETVIQRQDKTAATPKTKAKVTSPARPTPPSPSPRHTREPEEETPRVSTDSEMETLPSNPPDLYHSLLILKGVPRDKAATMTKEFRLSEWAWNDAQEIATMLRSAGVAKSPDWVRSFLKQYGYAIQRGFQGQGIEFFPPRMGGGGSDYYGSFGLGFGGGRREDSWGGPPRQEMSPLERTMETYLRLQMSKDMRRGSRYDEEPDSQISALVEKIERLESDNQRLAEYLQNLNEKQEKDALLTKIENLERQIHESKAAATSDATTHWAEKAQEAREKRMEELLKHIQEDNNRTIQMLTSKLEETKAELKETKEHAQTAASRAVEEERNRRTAVKQELQDLGFLQRAKTPEEEWMGIVKEQVAPGVGTELKRIGNLVERVANRIQPGSEETINDIPIGPSDADKLNQLMEIEAQYAGT
jgi:hypothetical protein